MIYCIGDSFTFGAELPDALATGLPSQSAWPYMLGLKLGKPVTNLGRQATGSTRAIKRAMDCVYKGDADIIIVAWPNADRIEWCDENGIYDIWPGRQTALMPADRTDIVKQATRDWSEHTDHWNYRRWLRNIILLQTFFKAHDQKYIMLQTQGTTELTDQWVDGDKELFDRVDPRYFLGWPNHSMMTWTQGLPQGTWGHFLSEGHAAVADKVYEHIRNIGWVS